MVQFKKQTNKKMTDKIQDLKTVVDKSAGDVLTARSIDKVLKNKTQILDSQLKHHILDSSYDQTRQCYNPKNQPTY